MVNSLFYILLSSLFSLNSLRSHCFRSSIYIYMFDHQYHQLLLLLRIFLLIITESAQTIAGIGTPPVIHMGRLCQLEKQTRS